MDLLAEQFLAKPSIPLQNISSWRRAIAYLLKGNTRTIHGTQFKLQNIEPLDLLQFAGAMNLIRSLKILYYLERYNHLLFQSRGPVDTNLQNSLL